MGPHLIYQTSIHTASVPPLTGITNAKTFAYSLLQVSVEANFEMD